MAVGINLLEVFMYSLKSLRVAKGKSTKATAEALNITEDKYQRKENCPDKLTVGECKLIIVFLHINILEFAEMLFEPHSEPHPLHKNIL